MPTPRVVTVKENVHVIVAKYHDLSINKQLIIDADNEKPRDKNVSAVQVLSLIHI